MPFVNTITRDIKHKSISGHVKELNASEGAGYLIGVASTGGIDRDGDIIEPKGWLFDRFNKNPIMLYGHNRSGMLPIGSVEWIRVEGNDLVFKANFSSIQLAQDVRQLYVEGILKTFSIGFTPIEYAPIVSLDGSITGYRFIRQELDEISAVPLPANDDARVIESKALDENENNIVDHSIALTRHVRARRIKNDLYKRVLAGMKSPNTDSLTNKE